MTKTNTSYSELTAKLQAKSMSTDAAEIQGILCGMLAGGMSLEDREWQEALADFINEGKPLAENIASAITVLYDEVCQQLIDSDFALTMCLPNDDSEINIRGKALILWVQGFMLGFGIHQADLTKCSADAKEALEDFAEIARMDEQMAADEESEKALFEVVEYVRMSALMVFNELGHSATDQQAKPKTIH
ncbi:UPF0149 family protein [Alteromonadaceae bacterium BrNp21-10]|nr:UPF0149 family protein [Alteromonadaceae bacterium BrNp21-10]